MTEEVPLAPKNLYGFNNRKALVVTHPFERFHAAEEEIEQFLDGAHEYDEVFYVPQSEGRVPRPREGDGKRSKLPPGFLEGHYEKGLMDDGHGRVNREWLQVLDMLQSYDEISFGGARRYTCVKNTYQSFEDVRDDVGLDTDLSFEEEITYPEL